MCVATYMLVSGRYVLLTFDLIDYNVYVLVHYFHSHQHDCWWYAVTMTQCMSTYIILYHCVCVCLFLTAILTIFGAKISNSTENVCNLTD